MGFQKLTWCDDLAGQDLDGQPALVKVLNVDGTAGERGKKVDLGVVVEVVTLAGADDPGLRALPNSNDNNTCRGS